MCAMKTSSNHSQPQHSSTPAQDIVGVCAELQDFSLHVTAEQWDVLRRLIATLHGVADEIDGLVRPGSEED